MRLSKIAGVWLVGASLIMGGCVSVQPTAFPIGRHRLPAKPADALVEVFREGLPSRPFEPVARLNVHIEKTFFIPSAFQDALPQLEKLARQYGADALIEIAEKKSRLSETFIYNVTATAISYRE